MEKGGRVGWLLYMEGGHKLFSMGSCQTRIPPGVTIKCLSYFIRYYMIPNMVSGEKVSRY